MTQATADVPVDYHKMYVFKTAKLLNMNGLLLLTDEERVSLFRLVVEGYCRDCGRYVGSSRCLCGRDE